MSFLEKLAFGMQALVNLSTMLVREGAGWLETLAERKAAEAEMRTELTPEARFWAWFQANAERLKDFESPEDPVFEELMDQLGKLNEELTYALGSLENGLHDFVVSANGVKEAIPVVRRLIAAAPALPGWKFTAFRPRMQHDSSVLIEFEHLRLSPQQLWFRLQAVQNGVRLELFVPDADPEENQVLQGAVYILLDAALGEFDVMTKVQDIDWKPVPRDPAGAGLFPWTRLPAVFDRLMASLSN